MSRNGKIGVAPSAYQYLVLSLWANSIRVSAAEAITKQRGPRAVGQDAEYHNLQQLHRTYPRRLLPFLRPGAGQGGD